MIIITGIGRCGTSMLAEYCQDIGLYIGNVSWIDKYDAGNEDSETTRINNIIYKYGVSKNILNDIEVLERDVVKDPHFLRDTSIIKAWWSVRDDLKIVWCRRDPGEIVKSQKRIPEMTCPTYRCFEDMIIQKELQFESTLEDLGIEYHELWYPEFLGQYEKIYEIFGGHRVAWDVLAAVKDINE